MLGNIQQTMNRIEQIENRIEQGPKVDSAAFKQMLNGAEAPIPAAIADNPTAQNLKMGDIQGVNPQLWGMMNGSAGPANIDPSSFGAAVNGSLNVAPLAQNNGVSCGQTSVAMAVRC